MRRTLVVLAALAAILLVAVLGALLLVPDSVYRAEIIKAAEDATGRDLTIEGDIGLSLYPVLGVKAEGVALANAPGFSAPHFARMRELDVGVRLLPLLSGKVEIARFVLVEPDIALEVDAKGRDNWTFETGAEERPESAEPGEREEGDRREVSELSLGTMRLIDGRVSYANRESGERWEASGITLSVALRDLDSPLRVEGHGTWKGERVALALKAEEPRALLDGATSPVELDVKSSLVELSFSGEAEAGESPTLSGPVDLSTPSLRKLLSWLSEPMGPGETLGAFALKGDLALKGDVTRIDKAALSLDGMNASGKISVDTARTRPLVNAALAFDRLNLDPYLKGSSSAPAPAPAQEGGSAGSGGTSGSASGGSGWSTERMDLSGLKAADADLALSAGKALFAGMTLSDASFSVRLRNGVLSASLPNLKLYGGTGSANVVVDASGSVPQLRSSLAFDRIALEPFLRDTAELDRLTGTGALTLALASRGTSELAMMQGLNGAGSLKLVNGAVRGVDLGAMVQNIASAFTGQAVGGAQKTEFSELGGSFAIQNGVLANNDFLMVNPHLRLAGVGTANIANRTLDYHFVPKVVKSSQGEGALDLTGVSVPVRVTGSWDNLKFAPDTKGLVEGAMKGVSEALGAGQDPLKGLLKGIFGLPGAEPEEQQGTSGTSESPEAAEGGTGEPGPWAPGGTSADEGDGGEPAPQDQATEAPPPTPEEQFRNIFQEIFKEE